MSNLFVDGFAHYGVGTSASVLQNLLSGTYAQADIAGITSLPWDEADTDLYSYSGQGGPLRYVLPATENPVVVSMYFALDQLPTNNNTCYAVRFNDGSNTVIAQLAVQSTGVLQLQKGDTGVLLTSGGPVIRAETATQLEMKLDVAGGTFALYAAGTEVLSGSGLVFTGSGNCAQLAFHTNLPVSIHTSYVSNLIIRNTGGSYNNTFPIGDRRVATLFVNSDVAAHQGWTGEPRHLFSAGLLDNRASTSTGIVETGTVNTDLGTGDFTIEGWFRFIARPTGGNKAQLFGKWDETNNKRSYQFYMGGNTLESGNTVFRISTDGTAGTVTELFSYPWNPDTDTWYHVAVVRASAETLLFVNGIQLGLAAADSHAYYAGTEPAALGVQDDSGTIIANTAFNGFIGNFRLTVGYARYTSDFARPTAAFPIGSVLDPHWTDVAWLSNWDSGLNDESQYAATLFPQNGAAFLTPNDGQFNYQTLNKPTPFDDTFIEAALIPATGILTQTALPTNGKEVTVGTYTSSGSHAAVYTWNTVLGGAFSVLIGADVPTSLANLEAAINLGAGMGTLYGTGTIVNNDVTASALPGDQMLVTANTPGTAGNAVASTTNDPNGSWGGATLSGGQNIPPYSAFGFQRPPNETTIIDSISLVHRDFKTDSGTCTVQASFVGAGGGVAAGTANNVSTVPTYYRDTIEQDPDTSAALTPSSIVGGSVKMNRTA